MKVESVSIATLSQDPANARKHDDKNLEAIKASLRRFGQQKPIVVDSSNVVRAGNGTLAAAIALGWDSINVVQTDLQGSEATAYAIADNRTAELAEWDESVLAASLSSLADVDVNLLSESGFSDEEVEKLLQSFDVADGEMPDSIGEDERQFAQMTFTLHVEQKLTIDTALATAKKTDCEQFDDVNGNGNALYAIAKRFLSES